MSSSKSPWLRESGGSDHLSTLYIPEKKYVGASVRPPAQLSWSASIRAGERGTYYGTGTESRTHWLSRVRPADDTPRGSPAPAIFDEVLTPFSAAPCARTESELGVTVTLPITMWKVRERGAGPCPKSLSRLASIFSKRMTSYNINRIPLTEPLSPPTRALNSPTRLYL